MVHVVKISFCLILLIGWCDLFAKRGDCGPAPKQGPPGPQGPEGPQGPPGPASASDFGFAFILNSAMGTTVGDQDFVPFTTANFTNTPPGTSLSIVNSGTSSAAIEVADTGFYQVTYGVSVGAPNTIWQIKLGGAGGPSLGEQTLQTAGLSAQLTTASCIVEVTVNPTTVGLQNISGASELLQNNTPGDSAIVAFISIVKLL